ncbi:MAG: carbohydrate ABC transporter permease [Anaerolineales bacterium]|nr:carbohydrate ABC transporter permease [Anaerolineales bacterium]
MRIRIKSWDDLVFQILVNGFLLTVLLVVTIPIWRVFIMSITPLAWAEGTSLGLWIPPGEWSNEAYKQLFNHPAFLQAATNSVIITVGGTAINLFLTVPLAYALSNENLPGRKFLVTFILIPFLFHAGLIPTYLVVQKLGLVDNLLAVMLPGAVSVYNTLVMKGFFEGLPEELKEAARLDGANEVQVLWHVILPLSKPILLTIGLFYAVSHWNEFFNPILYLNRADLQPLPVLLRNILLAANINEYLDYDAFARAPIAAFKAASVFITMLPMVIVYPWIQRYFTKGTLLGAVKE